jgi:molybdate transport system substrate-binding protein
MFHVRFMAASGAICLAAGVFTQTSAHTPALTVAAASDLQSVLPAIASRYEAETGHRVTLTFGSSGNFFAQIQNGAPFDLFFSADIDYARRLESAGLTEPGSLRPYAIGRLVLYASARAGIDLTGGLAVLTDPRVRRIAIANPDHAPYGRAALAALRHERLDDQVRGKLVLGENISQAAQFVQSGNAEAGLLALSLALAPALRGAGSYVEVPSAFYPPIEQTAVIVKSSRGPDGPRRFLAFLEQPRQARALRDAGFLAPQPAATAR